MTRTTAEIDKAIKAGILADQVWNSGYSAGRAAAAKEFATEHIIETWAQWLYDAGYPYDFKTFVRGGHFPPVQLPPPLPVLDKLADIYAARDGLMAPSWQALRLEVGIE